MKRVTCYFEERSVCIVRRYYEVYKSSILYYFFLCPPNNFLSSNEIPGEAQQTHANLSEHQESVIENQMNLVLINFKYIYSDEDSAELNSASPVLTLTDTSATSPSGNVPLLPRHRARSGSFHGDILVGRFGIVPIIKV